MKNVKVVILAAGLALLGGVSAAWAEPGVASANVNVRSGPGTNYAVAGSLSRGQRVEVTACRTGWCYVERGRLSGYVSARYLNVAQPRSGFSFSINFGNFPTPQRSAPTSNPNAGSGPGQVQSTPSQQGPTQPGPTQPRR